MTTETEEERMARSRRSTRKPQLKEEPPQEKGTQTHGSKTFEQMVTFIIYYRADFTV